MRQIDYDEPMRLPTKLAPLAFALLTLPAVAQKKKDLEDPFTKGDAEAMAELGIVAFAPFAWADHMRTEDVERVLGADRIRWVETKHFCIGSTLEKASQPQDAKARKIINQEFKELHDKFGKMPKRSSKMSPWLRTHLFAHRAESLYAEFAELVGHEDETTHLGQKGKLLLLLFQKRSDIARYAERFCDRQTTVSLRHLHTKTGQRLLAIAVEGDDGDKDEAAFYGQFRYMLMLVLHDAIGGAPYWLTQGLAHHYERQIPSNLMNCAPKEGEHVDPQTQNDWERKLGKRLEHDELVIPFERICMTYDLGYHGHLQAWSRVEYLLELDRAKFAAFLQNVIQNKSQSGQSRALREVYEMEPEEFDERWRQWALKTY